MDMIRAPWGSECARFAVALLCGLAVSLGHAQTTVAGFTPGSFQVTPGGAATYTIPIQVPPGIAGVEPSLAVSYSSQGGNGLLGMGWTLAGLSAVNRCPRTIAQDGSRGGVNFDANDRFCLDGQRLISIGTAADCAGGTEYRTELESFSRVISCGTAGNGPAYFKVWTKAGQIIEYGNTADSRIEAVAAISPVSWPAGTVRVWALNKISDRKSNYLTVAYTEDSANGDYYPIEIDYTGNAATAPASSVQFVYATRPDIVPAYQAGALMRTTQRLTHVKTFNGPPASNKLIRDYQIAYDSSPTTFRSRVVSVTECSAATQCLSPSTFSYPSGTPGWTAVSTPVPDYIWTRCAGCQSDGRQLIDVNGDGLPDLVVALYEEGPQSYKVWLNTGAGWQLAPYAPPDYIWARCAGNTCQSDGRQLIDVNGDGLPDLVVALYEAGVQSYKVWLNTGAGWQLAPYTVPNYIYTRCAGCLNDGRQLIDVNGDGLPDLVVALYEEGPQSYKVWQLNMPQDVISSFTNGLGSTTTVGTQPLTNGSVYTKDNPVTSYPILSLQSPMYVVSSSTVSNGVGGTYQTNYTYAGAKADQLGRGFLGFRNFTSTDPQTQITTGTTFRQDYPFIGIGSQTKKSTSSVVLNEVDNTLAATSFGGTRYFPYVSQSVASGHDLNGAALPTVTTTTVYDAYGNATSIVASTGDGYSKTTANTYAAPDTANWFIGRLIRSTVTSVTP